MHFSVCVISVQVTVSLGYFCIISVVCDNMCIFLRSFLAELLEDFASLSSLIIAEVIQCK